MATTADMDGWLKTHAVFIAAMCASINSCGGDAVKLAADRECVATMIRAAGEGFRALTSKGIAVQPRPLRMIFTVVPRVLAVRYRQGQLRGTVGTVALAPHTRMSKDTELPVLYRDVQKMVAGLIPTPHLTSCCPWLSCYAAQLSRLAHIACSEKMTVRGSAMTRSTAPGDVSQLPFAGLLLVADLLGDRMGRKRILQVGLVFSALTSLAWFLLAVRNMVVRSVTANAHSADAGPALWRLSSALDAPWLLCLHHAGGDGASYANWAAELAETRAVWTANVPGRRGLILEPLITDPDILVAELADAAEALLDRPLATFGHTMGALLGYEVARELPLWCRPARPPTSARRPSQSRATISGRRMTSRRGRGTPTRWRGIHALAGGHFYLVPAGHLVLDAAVRAVTEGVGLMQQGSGIDRERAR